MSTDIETTLIPNPVEEQALPEVAQQTMEQEYIIDHEFRHMLLPKTQEQHEALKETIRADGKVRDSLVVWDEENILIDGHGREQICKELGIALPPIVRLSFASRDDAKMWVLRNQLTRRNLHPFQQIEAAVKFKELFAAKARANQQGGVPLKSGEGIEVGKELAKLVGVSPDTVRKVERILEKASPEEKDALRNGDAGISINSVYRKHCAEKKSVPPSAPNATPRNDAVGNQQDDKTLEATQEPTAPSANPPETSNLTDEGLNDWLNKAKEEDGCAGESVSETAPLEDKNKVLTTMERMIRNESPVLPPTKSTEVSDQEFLEKMQSGEYNGKLFKKNVATIRTALGAGVAALKECSSLFPDTIELASSQEQEGELREMLGLAEKCGDSLIALVAKYRHYLTPRVKTGNSNGCPSTMPSNADDKDNEDSAHDAVGGKGLMKLESAVVPKLSLPELAEYIKSFLDVELGACLFDKEVLPHFDGDRVPAMEFIREYGFEVVNEKVWVAGTAGQYGCIV